jgi:hypothetical protein
LTTALSGQVLATTAGTLAVSASRVLIVNNLLGWLQNRVLRFEDHDFAAFVTKVAN